MSDTIPPDTIRGPEHAFSKVRGILSTRVGYTGGVTPNPTYTSVCAGNGHTEAIKLEFDPKQISYERILQMFWHKHNPRLKANPQYKSAIWATNSEQLQTALESRTAYEARHRCTVATDIEMVKRWYDAEEYHQKFMRKQSSLLF